MRVAKLYPIDGGARWGAPWYDASGKRRAVTAPTVEEAVAKRAKRMAGWTSDEKLGDFLAWWTAEYLPRRVANGRLAEETMDGYESSVRLHITPRIGAVGLTDLTATLLEDWLDELDDDGLGARGRQKALRTLSVALSVAVKRDLIGRNPARGVEGPRVVAKRVTPWTRAQAGAFITIAAEMPQLHGNLWLVQLGTGLRPSEALALHVDDVDVSRARARVHRNLSWRKGGRWVIKTTKGEDDVWLALPEFAVSAVSRHLEVRAAWAAWDGWQEHGRLFTARAGTPLRGTSIGKPLTELRAQAGVPRVTPHGIRHQTASALLAAARASPTCSTCCATRPSGSRAISTGTWRTTHALTLPRCSTTCRPTGSGRAPPLMSQRAPLITASSCPAWMRRRTVSSLQPTIRAMSVTV